MQLGTLLTNLAIRERVWGPAALLLVVCKNYVRGQVLVAEGVGGGLRLARMSEECVRRAQKYVVAHEN